MSDVVPLLRIVALNSAGVEFPTLVSLASGVFSASEMPNFKRGPKTRLTVDGRDFVVASSLDDLQDSIVAAYRGESSATGVSEG